MKKIFAFAMAIVSMAAVMTSCGNDDADFIEQKAPAPVVISTTTIPTNPNPGVEEEINREFDGNIYFAAYEQQSEYLNNSYTVQIGSESVEITIEDLPVATNLPLNVETFFKRCERTEGFVRPTIYVYEVPAGISGNINVTTKLSVKEGVELPAMMNVIGGASTNVKVGFSARQQQTQKEMPAAIKSLNESDLLGTFTK